MLGHWSGCLGNLAGVALFVFVSILQISAFFLFSNIRKGRLLYIHPVGWLVGRLVGRSVGWLVHGKNQKVKKSKCFDYF